MYARDRIEVSRLDGRRAAYQIDAESDLPWHELSSPGRHMPVEFLAEAGFSVPALNPDLASLVDWAFALSTCETFIALEQVILEFAERERAALPESRSIALLRDEEIKHIHMFERYAEHLRACRPREDRELFERVFAPGAGGAPPPRRPGALPEPRHVSLRVLAQYGVRRGVHDLFRRPPRPQPGVQPMWRALHAAHRREESQHVVTDAHFLESLQLDEASLREQSQLFADQPAALLRHRGRSRRRAGGVRRGAPGRSAAAPRPDQRQRPVPGDPRPPPLQADPPVRAVPRGVGVDAADRDHRAGLPVPGGAEPARILAAAPRRHRRDPRGAAGSLGHRGLVLDPSRGCRTR